MKREEQIKLYHELVDLFDKVFYEPSYVNKAVGIIFDIIERFEKKAVEEYKKEKK